MNPGPPALEASTIPLGYRGGVFFKDETVVMKFYIVVVHYLKMSMKEENEGPEYFERDKLVFGDGRVSF